MQYVLLHVGSRSAPDIVLYCLLLELHSYATSPLAQGVLTALGHHGNKHSASKERSGWDSTFKQTHKHTCIYIQCQ